MRNFFILLMLSRFCFGVPLNWQSFVEEAASNNPELKAGKNKLNASEYQVWGQYGSFLPQVTGSLGYTYGTSSSNNVTLTDPGSDNASSRYTASLTATENLFSGLQDAAKLSQSKANNQSVSASYEITRAKISLDLKAVFAGMLYAKKFVELSETIVQRRTSNLKNVEMRFKSGRENKGSVLLSKAYLEQARLDSLLSQNAKEVAKAQMARVLGRDSIENLDVTGSLPIPSTPKQVNLAKLSENSPEYRQAVADVASSESGVTIARSGFFPSLNLTGSTTNTGNTFFPSNNRWAVGASVSIPLFSGGKDYFSTRSAVELSRAAELTRANVLRDKISKLSKALSDFREANQRLEVDKAFAEAATVRAKIAREKYNNGLISFEDWDIIENDLINRQKNLLQTERDLTVAEGNWELAQGKGILP